MGMNIVLANKLSPLIGAGVSAQNGATDQWFSIWQITRVMKAAGWVYKASADAINAKETTGNFLLDKWGPGGIVSGHTQFGSQTGGAAQVVSVSGNIATINGLSGMSASSVGHALTLSGANNAGNNGTFTIVAFNSSTSVSIFNANPAVLESTALTWSERVSGSGTISWSGISVGREQTITGLSGMTANSAGHYLNLSGSSNSNNNGTFQILKYVSATSVVIVNTAGGANTASGVWTELDPLLDVYPPLTNLSQGSWILFQGPSTLKIPINAPATGNFLRGENITQSGSSAQGELIGYQYDTPSAQGYLVVMPRQNGTGSGKLGWSTVASTITGGSSGATVTTANGSTPVEYVRETMIWKATTGTNHNNGQVFHCVLDGYSESASRFSSFLNATGCTNTVPPGSGNGVNNGNWSGTPPIPGNGAFMVRGQAGTTNGQTWFSGILTNDFGYCSFLAANADYTLNSSADGTFTAIVGTPSINNGAFNGFGFWRVDNNEDGDVDPYVWFWPSQIVAYGDTRTIATGGATATGTEHFCHATATSNTSWFKGVRRRGFSTNDMMQQFQTAALSAIGTTSSATTLIYSFTSDPDLIATSLSSTPPRVRDPIWIVSTQLATGSSPSINGKMRKGTLRWAFTVHGLNSTDTLDSKKWIQVSNSAGAWVIGPWDGYTTLLQS